MDFKKGLLILSLFLLLCVSLGAVSAADADVDVSDVDSVKINDVVNENSETATVLTTYISPAALTDIIWLIVIAPVAYIALQLIKLIGNRISAVAVGEPKRGKSLIITWLVIFAVILISVTMTFTDLCASVQLLR